MGGTSWDDDHYRARSNTRAAKGESAFEYSRRVMSAPIHERKIHPEMDPKGVSVRESRDSDAHPESVAIGVIFDVTASMHSVPQECQARLPQLMGTLINKNYCKDPQVLYGAVTDFDSNQIPLQIGQFESGIEMDEDLGKIILEGGGGGTYEESYELALYFFARHTSIDCFEKRGKKGYLFLVGDEKTYRTVTPAKAEAVFGDKLQAPVEVETLIKEVQEKYNLFFIIPEHTSHGKDPSLRTYWEDLLGENVVMMPNASQICDIIAAKVGALEGLVDVSEIQANTSNVGAAGANVRL